MCVVTLLSDKAFLFSFSCLIVKLNFKFSHWKSTFVYLFSNQSKRSADLKINQPIDEISLLLSDF